MAPCITPLHLAYVFLRSQSLKNVRDIAGEVG